MSHRIFVPFYLFVLAIQNGHVCRNDGWDERKSKLGIPWTTLKWFSYEKKDKAKDVEF